MSNSCVIVYKIAYNSPGHTLNDLTTQKSSSLHNFTCHAYLGNLSG